MQFPTDSVMTVTVRYLLCGVCCRRFVCANVGRAMSTADVVSWNHVRWQRNFALLFFDTWPDVKRISTDTPDVRQLRPCISDISANGHTGEVEETKHKQTLPHVSPRNTVYIYHMWRIKRNSGTVVFSQCPGWSFSAMVRTFGTSCGPSAGYALTIQLVTACCWLLNPRPCTVSYVAFIRPKFAQ